MNTKKTICASTHPILGYSSIHMNIDRSQMARNGIYWCLLQARTSKNHQIQLLKHFKGKTIYRQIKSFAFTCGGFRFCSIFRTSPLRLYAQNLTTILELIAKKKINSYYMFTVFIYTSMFATTMIDVLF